jgi:hypothetical protein
MAAPLSKKRHSRALVLSMKIVIVTYLPGQLGGGLVYVAVLAVLDPGIVVSRWFMTTHFATPTIRLAIVGIVSILIYWPVLHFVLEFISERKQVLRSVTQMHVLPAFCIGAAASVLTFKLVSLVPFIFGILTVPSDYVFVFLNVVAGGARSLRWFIPLRLASGWIAYSVIAFFVLYRTRWRQS